MVAGEAWQVRPHVLNKPSFKVTCQQPKYKCLLWNFVDYFRHTA